MSEAKPWILAIDLGGTSIRAARADATGRLHQVVRVPTQAHQGPERVISRIVELLGQLLPPEGWGAVRGLGVSVAGPLDPYLGILLTPPNLPGWRDVPLKEILERKLGVGAFLGNDANLAALAEHAYGAGRGVDDLVYLTVSTGIGGGIILGGELLLGAGGLAGEVGHMTILEGGPQCNCGNYGCLEALASGTAIARRAREMLAEEPASIMLQLVQGDASQITAEIVGQAAQRGDGFALQVMAEAGHYLGVGVLNLVHIFNPRRVVIGGGVAQAGELLLEPARRVVTARAMPNFLADLEVVPGLLGDDAGLLGAVALVRRALP